MIYLINQQNSSFHRWLRGVWIHVNVAVHWDGLSSEQKTATRRKSKREKGAWVENTISGRYTWAQNWKFESGAPWRRCTRTRQQHFERESPWATKSAPRPDLARNHEDRAPSIREQKIQRTLARLLSAEQKDWWGIETGNRSTNWHCLESENSGEKGPKPDPTRIWWRLDRPRERRAKQRAERQNGMGKPTILNSSRRTNSLAGAHDRDKVTAGNKHRTKFRSGARTKSTQQNVKTIFHWT
jgi:hypothetical protein